MMMKAACQPHSSAITGTVIGARMAPILAPELKMPVAKERSFFGKYSAVALMAAGKLPASPSASTARPNMKPATETGTAAMPTAASILLNVLPIATEYACRIAPTDHTTIASTKALRVPILSITRPANSIEIAYTNWNTAAMLA